MGKRKKTAIGYKYFMGLHMGVARQVDELCEVQVGGKQAWIGSQKTNGSITISAPNLFGGDKAEGGIEGQLDVMLGGADQVISDGTGQYNNPQPEFTTIYDQYGHPTQVINPARVAAGGLKYLLQLLALPITHYRGVTTLFYDGEVCSMNPYPKPWKFRMRRHTGGWDGSVWYPETVMITRTGYSSDGTSREIKPMNPAHILYQCATDRVWGRGLPRSLLDDAAWRYAADQLHAEGLGLCLRWSRQDTLQSFIQTVLDHINGLLFVDKQSGLLKLKLIREDYNADTLPVFDTDSGIIAITEAENAALNNLTNEIIVTYNNVVDNEDGQVRVHNLASIQTQGCLISKTVEYPGCPDAALALKLAQRDLKIASTNIRRFNLDCDRRAWHVQPGDVFKIRDPKTRGIGTVIVRVGQTEESDITNGTITIIAVQDTFGFPLSTFSSVQPPQFVSPDTQPALARRRVYEAPYAELAGAMPPGEFATVKAEDGYIAAHGEQPTGLCLGFELAVRAQGEFAFESRGSGDFTPLAELVNTLDYLSEVLTYTKDVNLGDYSPGCVALIGEEFIQIVYVDASTRTMGIKRGVWDTVPARHFGGSLIWVTDSGGGTDWRVYAGGEHVDMKLLPWTMGGGAYPEALAPVDSIDFNFRWFRPYAPGLVGTTTILGGAKHWYETQQLKTDVGPDEVDDTLLISWTHRDRPLQADRIIDHMQGSIGPEPGTTYRIKVIDAQGNLVREITDITGTSYAYSYESAAVDFDVADAPAEPVIGSLELHAYRDNFYSWQYYRIPIQVYKRPPQTVVVGLDLETVAQVSDLAADDAGIAAALSLETVAQESEETDLRGANIAAVETPIAQRATLLPLIDFRLYEAPYLTLLRDGRDTESSQILALTARPSDRIVSQVALLDRLQGETSWGNSGPTEWTPWAVLSTKVNQLTDTLTFSDTSIDDGGTFDSILPGSLLLVDNELMVINAITPTGAIVGRGVADTVPAEHNANVPIWLFDPGHGISSRQYGPADITEASLLPLDYAGQVSPGMMPTKTLQMQDRPLRPYPPGLVLANGNHWFVPVSALADGFDAFAPAGKDALFTWEHRNRTTQGAVAKDHYEAGISAPDGIQYKIWIGYTARGGSSVTLFNIFTASNSWTLTKAMAEELGERAGRALEAGGYVAVSMAINAVQNGRYNWQGYSMLLKLPSYPLTPGTKPGGNTDPSTGGGGSTGGGSNPDPVLPPNPGNPGDGDSDNVDPTPTDPTDPDVPPTDPEVPVIPPVEKDIPGWGNSFDHGWASNI